MGGRGRGRGGAGRGLSFNIDALGISRSEGVPTAIYQPPPLFPTLQFKAHPLEVNEEYNYMLALKQEFRGNAQESAHFVKAALKKKDIDRYSDKYKLAQAGDEFQPDWIRLPPEIKPLKKRKQKVVGGNDGATRKKRKLADSMPLDVIKDLDKAEEHQSEEEEAGDATEVKAKKDGEEDEEDEEEEEEYEEEEGDEENDYVAEYFDNGEDYGNDDDDNVDEGATY